MILILHNIRSAHNVGSMFRTADCAGVAHIILSGYTPGPVDPQGKLRRDFLKVSLGAEGTVPYTTTKTLGGAIKKARQLGYTVAAIEQTPRSTSLFAYKQKKNQKLAVVMGNEVKGLLPRELKLCDEVLEIPMHGSKESLNVSVACGIALFTLGSAL